MGKDFSDQTKPPLLKRFANLDIDGVEKPARPERAAKTQPSKVARVERPSEALSRLSDEEGLQALQDEINAQARDAAARATPQARRAQRAEQLRGGAARPSFSNFTTERARFDAPSSSSPEERRAQRAAELRATRPMDPSPGSVGAMARQAQQPPLSSRAPSVAAELFPERLPGGGGVMTMEIDLRARQRQTAPPLRSNQIPSPGVLPASFAAPPQVKTPVTLTSVAARQIQLMAWEAGVPGSPLRILLSHSPGLGRPELDFAFDDSVSEDDVVFDALGVTIIIDRQSLPLVQGRHISWQDLPGSEGFIVG